MTLDELPVREQIRTSARVEASGDVLKVVLTCSGVEGGTFAGLAEKKLHKAIRRSFWNEPSDLKVEGVATSPAAVGVTVTYLPSRRTVLPLRQSRRDRLSDPATFLREADRLTELMRRSVVRRLKRGQQPAAQVSATWVPGPGLTVIADDSDGAPAINARIDELKAVASRSKSLAFFFFVLVGVLFAAGLVFAFLYGSTVIALGSLIYAAMPAAMAYQARGAASEARTEIAELGAYRDLQSIGSTAERLARQLFRINELEVRRYYAQSLRQRTVVFGVGVGVIAVGLALAAYSIHVVNHSASTKLSDKIVIAALGGAGTISANLVAAVFLRMFSDIVASSTTFHDRLVLTHHVHYGNVLAASIEDVPTRDATLAQMAKALAREGAPSGGNEPSP